MNRKSITSFASLLCLSIVLVLGSCKDKDKKTSSSTETTTSENEVQKTTYASDVIPFFDDWKLILGDGSNVGVANKFENKDFFYTVNENNTDWVVFKAPNGGDTHGTSNNTRTELAQAKKWYPKTADDKLTATLKVMNVSATGDARVAATHAVVVGQIHSADAHENEPLKIFYKKFPGHTKGSVFWHYEINTAGEDNSGRWDYSSAVWGNDFSVVGKEENTYPEEPKDGIALGEEFSYEINVYEGIMYLTFTSEGHETKTFTKSLIKSDFPAYSDIPEQILSLYAAIGRDGTERKNAYQGEDQNFKQGAYNQTNGKDPKDNIVWHTGSETYGGDISKQYANGCYAEVWFKEATLGEGTPPKTK